MATTLQQALGPLAPALPLAVACSGGADSSALLVACARRWPGEVAAIHVHHGLQAAADGFEQHCAALCTRLGVPLHVVRVDARHATGESPEDSARQARYRALQATALSHGIASVVLAQHADDQVETMLLALSRGAGPAGLAGMRPAWEEGGVRFLRPLLDVRPDDLKAFLRDEGFGWVEDPTNTDERFTRNRIRRRLLPALLEAFPQARETFARSARLSAQASSLLDAFASQDLAAVGHPPSIEAVRALARPRQANLLRQWLREDCGTQASEAQLEELLDQLHTCATRAHRLRLRVGAGFVERDGARLAYVPSV